MESLAEDTESGGPLPQEHDPTCCRGSQELEHKHEEEHDQDPRCFTTVVIADGRCISTIGG